MTHPSLATPDQLADLGAVRLLYVPAADERPSAMIPVPIAAWIDAARRGVTGLDDLAYWQSEIEALWVGPDALTVVVDDGTLTEAARVWFILQHFGLPAAVLNGGLPALTHLPSQAAPHRGRIVLCPGAGPVGLMSRQDLRGALGDVQILDARTAAEFRGEDRKGNARGGHLPGAVHLDHRDLLDAQRLRPASDLTHRMTDAGFDAARPVVTHCNGGGRAALAALAAVVAGQKDVRVYYLSFADWADDESCPVA